MTTRKRQDHRVARKTRRQRQQRPPTGNPVRNVPFLSWRNNSAWMETMRGPRWKGVLRRERRFFNTLLTTSVKRRAEEYERELKLAGEMLTIEAYTIGGGAIVIRMAGPNYQWRWIWSTKWHLVTDLDYYDNKIYYTEVDKHDSYITHLICEDDKERVLWKKMEIGGQVCVHNGLCYYIDVEYPFNTTELKCCDASTGTKERVLLKDPDNERFLVLIQQSGDTLYCQSTSWRETKTWRIEGTRATPFYPDTRFQTPLGKAPNGDECAFIIPRDSANGAPKGSFLKSWIFPPKNEAIQWIDMTSGFMITVDEGAKSLYLCAPHKRPKRLFSIPAGNILPNPWTERNDTPVETFYVFDVREPPYILTALPNSDTVHRPLLGGINPKVKELIRPIVYKKAHATSADGTRVPYMLIHSKDFTRAQLKGLICYVYSAYGSTSAVDWPDEYWGPLLRRGFAIAYAYCRGSGDKDRDWVNQGQQEHHIRTVEDFEAVVRDAQKATGLPPAQTIIYGRSAGGMMVGATTARNPDGALMGTTFTEVPFVDILRTQTNRTIDLTPSGMSEYGDPAASPVYFQAMLRLSPVNSLPVDGAPGVSVLCRTGLLDQQVLPFEPFKWIQRLRGTETHGPANKFISYEEREAHVYNFEAFVRTRAVDLAILWDWIEKKSHD